MDEVIEFGLFIHEKINYKH